MSRRRMRGESQLTGYVIPVGLELIWASTGIAIHHYIRQKEPSLEQLMGGDNNMVKAWFLYFKWASIWKEHKLGICEQICNFPTWLHLPSISECWKTEICQVSDLFFWLKLHVLLNFKGSFNMSVQ